VAVNIKFYYILSGLALAVAGLSAGTVLPTAFSAGSPAFPVKACVVPREMPLTPMRRTTFAECLGWQADNSSSICRGSYQSPINTPIMTDDAIHVKANEVSLYENGRSELHGNVEVGQAQQMVTAETAYIYHDAKTNQVTKIELLGGVRYAEPNRIMIARKATLNPVDKSGKVEDVLYLFNSQRSGAAFPAWGRARFIERFANQDYLLRKTTYTTCAPQDKSWQIEADSIKIDHAAERGVAKNAVLKVANWPLLYTPYLSFPTSKKRKSGFLMPMSGYSNVGGFDFALPYYLNLAPNYDATLVPHLYTRRGVMMGGDFRFLTASSTGMLGGNFLPNDKAFNSFLDANESQYPTLQDLSRDRWSLLFHESTAFTPNLQMNINYQQVSDDYYLQDFSSNLAILTENQLLHQGDVTYTTDHWLFAGKVQSYQTLHPINQTPIADVYERLPQLLANASYNDLPMHANFSMLGEFDYYRWPIETFTQPQGPRYHLSPVLSLPHIKPWGYITPSVELVEDYYDVHYNGEPLSNAFNRTIPRYSLDSGLTFERPTSFIGNAFTQTLEPRLYYLYVPYRNQTPIPVYDSGYMIFNNDQLFRPNRFSGFDRVGDTNQLAYALTSRWLSEANGQEKASVSVGQIRYFADRKVGICYQKNGVCVDSPLTLGYLSPLSGSSPIASRGVYNISPAWIMSGDYVWDPYTRATNNGDLNFHYQPAVNHIISFGYSYLTSGNLLQVGNSQAQDSALHQATVGYAWPFTEQWSGLGAYSYNISNNYSMMTLLGLQYDSCCWAMRLLGGRAFQSLSPNSLKPEYNNNVYLQVLLKGLGSVANSDPATTINSYLPGYRNMF